MIDKKLLQLTTLIFLIFISFSCVDKDGPGATNLEITSVTPESGTVNTEVLIKGSGFVPKASDNKVFFNETAAHIDSVTQGKIMTRVPIGSKSGPIQVQIGNKTATGPSFSIRAPKPDELAITGVSPDRGKINSEVTITGCGFNSEKSKNTVRFDGTLAEVLEVSSDDTTGHEDHCKDELIAVVPEEATTGPVQVSIANETVTGPVFTVGNNSDDGSDNDDGNQDPGNETLEINTISPTSGPTGTSVTISGSNFSTEAMNNTVEFNGTEALINNATSQDLTVEVPPSATTGEVKVTVDDQTATGPEFTVIDANGEPEYPINGSAVSLNTGTNGVCLGCGFSNENNIIDDNENNYGEVQIGAGVAGNAYVRVNSAADIPSGGEAGFVISDEGSLIDIGLLNTISITTYLDGNEQETISGSDALNLQLLSDDDEKSFIHFVTNTRFNALQIEFEGVAEVASAYRVYGAYGGRETETVMTPKINEVSPSVAPEGTEVKITGNNFSSTPSLNTVTFDGAEADIASASESELVVTVPNNATSGPLTVEVGNSEATLPNDFIVGSAPLWGDDLSATSDVSGVCAGCTVNGSDNIIDSDPDNPAEVNITVGLLNGTGSINIKSDQTYKGAGQAGFIVSRANGLIEVGLLNDIIITTYLNGDEQESASADNLALIGLLRSDNTERQFVGFNTTSDFDEIAIQFGGTASVNLTYQVFGVFDNYFTKE